MSASPAKRNLLWQFSGQGLGKAALFLFYILLPKLIGLEQYGKFAFSMALCQIAVRPLVEMGLDMVVVKWVSRGMPAVARKAFFIRITAALIVLPVLFLMARFIHVEKGLLYMLFFYIVLIVLQNTAFSLFRGMENMKPEGIMVFLQRVLALLLLPVGVSLGLRNAWLGAASLLSAAVLTTSAVFLVYRRPLSAAFRAGADHAGASLEYRDLIKEGLTLGGVTLLWLIYFRIDSVMLGLLRGDMDVAIYNVAYKLMEGAIFVPGVIMLVFFPQLARPGMFKKIFGELLFALVMLGLAASAALYLFSPGLVRMIYGAGFETSGSVLRILSLALFPIFLGHLVTQSLVSRDMHGAYLLAALTGTILNIMLNFALIPRFGATGAAWATVVTEATVASFCGYFIRTREPSVLSLDNFLAGFRSMASRL